MTPNKLETTPLANGFICQELRALAAGDHAQPHSVLGPHPGMIDGRNCVIIRALHPDAVAAQCILADGTERDMQPDDVPGVFRAVLHSREQPTRYRVRWRFGDGTTWECDDPYRFSPTLGEIDLHLFNEGTHRRLWRHLGAHPRTIDAVPGVAFAVWAPNARRVSVVGDFCRWDGRRFPMRQLGISGVFELFIPALPASTLYKYEIKTQSGELRLKADPLAFFSERLPGTASSVHASSYIWGDSEWMQSRPAYDPIHGPMTVYEVHLASWMRVPEEGNRPLTYREIAPRLVAHAKRLGFTHIELLPIAEHPYDRSWGYQGTGYFAPTSRFGTPDDFRYLVDHCHQNGIGVILDWVPGHFPKDDHGLRQFDGTALYEHADPRRGEHPDWGTLIFNYGRSEVRGFLIANALYWLEEFHMDGLRVDAVASMIYLDYSRKEGQWAPNRFGGREDLDAIDLLRSLNEIIRSEYPGRLTIAEESTAWPGVTAPPHDGGLGFTLKWNMGWMHDTLGYFAKDPVHRRHHHNELTFAMLYEHTERFLMPLSHDEVVHGKGSLLDKMPGDEWQKFANLRTLLAYQYTRPGKKLLFMGTEIAPWHEWNHEVSLDWHLADDSMRKGLARFVEELGRLYLSRPSLWKWDHEPGGFLWIDCEDRDNSVVSYLRSSGAQVTLVVLNLTPVPRDHYRIGAPVAGEYRCLMSSDDLLYGGSGLPHTRTYQAEPIPFHCFPQSLSLTLPPLGTLIVAPAP